MSKKNNKKDAPAPPPAPKPRRPDLRFMCSHPAHLIALGFGSGLSPKAPGTMGTLWAWLAYLALDHWLGPVPWGLIIAVGLPVGWWACTVTARHMAVADPSAVVWDEVIAFWIVLWLFMPLSLLGQAIAFGLFRFFDAVKPGPVRWADARFKGEPGAVIGWKQGFGILFDDLVAALCTLLSIVLWKLL